MTKRGAFGRVTAAIAVLLCFMPPPAYAAGGPGCSNPAGVIGDIVYNADIHRPQYCDGDDWVDMLREVGGGGCTAPTSCPNVGDVCSDGSLFAGLMLYGESCEALYVTDNNQSAASPWKNTTGTDDINPDDDYDGRANHTNRGGTLSDFPAFDLCESNTYHGKSDWYLPARNELHLLSENRAAIDANAAGAFTTSFYWSSTERDTNGAWYVYFSTGEHFYVSKTNNYDVRCVRRD